MIIRIQYKKTETDVEVNNIKRLNTNLITRLNVNFTQHKSGCKDNIIHANKCSFALSCNCDIRFSRVDDVKYFGICTDQCMK